MRRFGRALWPLALLVTMLVSRATGCKKEPQVSVPTPRFRITVRITPPPPRPTQTMPPGVTRIPLVE